MRATARGAPTPSTPTSVGQPQGVPLHLSSTGARTTTRNGIKGTRKRGPQAKPAHHIHQQEKSKTNAPLTAASSQPSSLCRVMKRGQLNSAATANGVYQNRPR